MAVVSYELVIASALIVVALAIYFFYSNRLVAFLANILLRLWGWKSGSASVWIEFRSIHFSLLSGRILLRDLRYHSSGLTARSVTCELEWRYWIRRPMEAEDLAEYRAEARKTEAAEMKYQSHSFPCRVHIKLRGLELYLYNRVASYDNIVSEMEKKAAETHPPQAGPIHSGFSIYRIFSKSSAPLDSTAMPTYPPSSAAPTSLRRQTFVQRWIDYLGGQLPTLDPKDLLPLSVNITKAIIICGNAATPNLLVMDAQKADGVIGIVPSRSKYDIYKQVFDFKFHNVNAQLLLNEDYQGSMVATGKRIRDKLQEAKVSRIRWLTYLSYMSFAKLWRKWPLVSALPDARTDHPRNGHVRTATQRMRRAFRRHEEPEDEIDYSTFEYAVERKLLEAPSMYVAYYVDNVGFVPTPIEGIHPIAGGDSAEDLEPEWGIDVVVHGGNLKYGPWADRQRAELQRAFFPSTYQDTQPAPPLKPGDRRVWPTLKIFIELRGVTSLAIPFREPSKNWQWDGKTKVSKSAKREPAYLTLKVSDGSTLSYTMPMIPGPNGYEPVLEVHLDSVSVLSSLNDTRFIEAESCRVRAELPSPLAWKALRQWNFAITLRTPVLYLLRDHINMFTDVSKDWSSGPTTPLHLWIPMIYSIDLTLRNYTINLYANDFNIIDTPLQKDSNVLFSFRGDTLRNKNLIPSDTYCPRSTNIPFTVEMPAVDVHMSVPRWNTHWSNDDEVRGHIGMISLARLDGSYTYHSEVVPGNTEQLDLHILVDGLVYKVFGWTIRSFMVLRENYFGGFTHFQTLGEHLSKRQREIPTGDPVTLKFRPGSVNPLQVLLRLQCRYSTLVLPAGLLGYETPGVETSAPSLGTCLVMQVPQQELVLRTHDYFMEMNTSMPVMKASIEPNLLESALFGSSMYRMPRPAVIVDGFDIVANRLFGPVPHVHTYVCMWEIKFGDVKASLSYADVQAIGAAVKSFGFNFTDAVNAPASELLPEVVPDVTFLSVSVGSIYAIWNAKQAAVEFALPKGLDMQSNDLAGQSYRKITSVTVPSVEMRVLQKSSTKEEWLQAGVIQMEIGTDIYGAPSGWEEAARLQRLFITEQDRPTGRLADVLQNRMTASHGRAVIRDKSYLQRAVPPHLRDSKKRPSHKKSKSRQRYDTPVEISDGSDVEQRASEWQRDALIARNKPEVQADRALSPLDDDDSLSEGDESDDTDFVTLDSHVGTGTVAEINPSDYDLCDCLDASNLRSPSTWGKSPFKRTRAAKLAGAAEAAFPTFSTAASDHALNRRMDRNEAPGGRTTIRLRGRSVQTTVIPTVMSDAITSLMNEVQSYIDSPELRIDAIILHRAAAISTNALPSMLSLHISVTDLVARSLQCVSRGETRALEGPTSVEVIVRNLHVAIQKPSKQSVVSATVGHVAVAASNLSATRPDPSMIVLRASISSRVAFANIYAGNGIGGSHFDLGHVLLDVTHQAPHSCIKIASSLAHIAENLTPTLSRFRAQRKEGTQLVAGIFLYSSQKRLVDQLSAAQPAYFVQQGRPHRLRTDVPFKMLLYIRSCLAGLKDRSSITWSLAHTEAVDHRAVIPCLVRLLEMSGSDSIQDQYARSVLESICPEYAVAPSATPRHFGHLQVDAHVRSLSLNILDPEGDAPSFITIGPIRFCLDSAVQLVVPSAAKSTKLPADVLDLSGHSVRRSRVILNIHRVNVSIRPHMIDFVRKAAGVRQRERITTRPISHTATPASNSKSRSTGIALEAVLRIQDVSITAAADTLTLETGLKGFTTAFSMDQSVEDSSQGTQLSANTSTMIEQVFLRALSTVEQSSNSDRGVLASLSLSGMKANGLYRDQGSKTFPVLRVIVGADGVRFSVPRSAVRLYRFVDEWKEKYLPKLNAATRELMSEIRRPSTSPPVPRTSRNMVIQVQAHVTSCLVALQVMRGTWLSWQLDRSMLVARSAPSPQHPVDIRHFGVKLASQAIGVSSSPELNNASVKARVKLNIPAILVMGRQDHAGVTTFASMDQLHVTVKPSHLDTVLTIQQKFGQDFNDLMALIEHTRRQKSSWSDVDQMVLVHPEQRKRAIRYNVHFKMRGLRIGLRGVRSTLFVECEDIKGGINNENGQMWQLRFSDAAVSVAPRENDQISRQSFNRSHRSAFVVVDLNATGENRSLSSGKVLRVELNKIHAVLQPSSIAEMADFVNDLQIELRARKEQRAAEMAEFKAKTLSIMRTFDVHGSELRPQPGQSLLSQYTISFSIKNIGAAFPLVLEPEVSPLNGLPRTPSGTRAFLFSVRSIGFGAHMGESGQATVKDFCFQFVPSFRPSVFSDYDGLNHATHNRMLYPEMTAQLRTETTSASPRLRINADVSGFVLDLDSTLPDYVFSLVDVYRHGKVQLDRINASVPLNPSLIIAEEPPSTPVDLPASNICASIVFRSGTIRLHSFSDIPSPRGRTTSFTRSDIALSDLGADIIKLPEVSVWSEYHGASAIIPSPSDSHNPCAELMFKSTVHSSQNTLFPSNILPFLSEFNTRLETRIHQSASSQVNPSAVGASTEQPAPPAAAPANLRVSVGLQIDKSNLEFTCQPDVNVSAGVHWQSGGFFLSLEPGMRHVAFSGAVKGLAISLRHGFLTDACANVEARNLVFSASFSRDQRDGNTQPAVSLLVETELVGGLRFSRLQDLLCFKAVWLDRIPIFNGPVPNEADLPPPSAVTKRITTDGQIAPFLTAVCVRVRKLNLDVDLGQSISTVNLQLQQLVVQTRLTHLMSEFRLHVASVSMDASGNISGRADVPDFMFRTTRVSENELTILPGHQMLQLEMTSGPLNLAVESEHQELLKYRAEPVQVRIYDDWSQAHHRGDDADSLLRLSFAVHGSAIAAAITVSSIPRLMVYVDKFTANLALQREGASRESKAFRIAQAPKPDNALSAVAEAMIQTARSRLSEAEAVMSYAILQGMDLRLQSLQLALFPRRMDDTEMAQFIGRGVEAHLERTIEPHGDLARRHLRLAFASMAVSRFTGLNHSRAKKEPTIQSCDWLAQLSNGAAEANIFGLPAMSMTMTSEEQLQGPRTLDYDFESTFRASTTATKPDDIYISLNVSLYSWLTFLRKNFAREMDEVRAAKPTQSKMTKPQALALSSSPTGLGPLSPRSDTLLAKSPASLEFFAKSPRSDSQSSEDTVYHDASDAARRTAPSSGFGTPIPISLAPSGNSDEANSPTLAEPTTALHRGIRYRPRHRSIERLTMRQLGEATPDVMHPFFMKKAGFSLEDSLPQYVHEYATQPLEEIMKALLELYSKQLKAGNGPLSV